MSDVPARIVDAASRFLPRERRAWGDAMSAELARLGDTHDRWLFAIGCARASLAAPALPDAGILRAVTATFLGGIVAALATTTYVLSTWPHAANAVSAGTVWWFALGLAVYLWIGVRPPRAMVSHRRAARRGVAAGFFLFVVTAVGRSIIDARSWLPADDLVIGLFLLPTVVGTIAFAAFTSARTERSFAAGVVASVWVGLVCSILAFNADMVAMLVGFNHEAHVLGTMPTYAGISPDAFLDKHIGDHLASSMQAIKNLPVVALLLGSITAAIGRARPTRPTASAILVVGVACSSAELLPAPTGPHKTGRMSFAWKDTTRVELETSAPDDKRELMVHVFYPTDANASGPRAVYMPDADVMRGPINDALMTQVTALRAFSLDGAPVQRGNARFPVVILEPGGGMKGLTYHTLLEDLASHGWVVAAIDPPYNARGVRFPDGRVLGNLPQAERGWPAPRSAAEDQRYYRERVAHWGRDVRFVIDQLAALDAGAGPFAKRLDLQRGVGVVGHSRGGQAAGVARVLDNRVRGGINLDGTAGEYPIQPIDGDTTVGAPPFLWIQKTLEAPNDAQLQRAGRTRAEFATEMNRIISVWHARLGQVSGGAMRIYVDRPGVAHIDFSDEPLWDASLSADARAAKLRTIADTRLWVRSFFEGTVRGDWTGLKRLVGEAGKSQPDVTVHAFGKMWP